MEIIELRDSPGKGHGLFAIRDIKMGENILQDSRIAVLDDNHLRNFAGYDKTLSPDNRRDQVLDLNGLPLNDGTGGLFKRACKINHSCRPNANYSGSDGVVRVQAIVDIPQGEEITFAYLTTALWENRQEELWKKFHFKCTCPACTVEDKRRDIGIRVANHLKDEIALTLMNDRLKTEHSLRTMVTLICQHLELRVELCSAMYDAFQFACANKDRDAAQHYIALWFKYSTMFRGGENEQERFRKFHRNPASHMIWGMARYPPSPVEKLDVEGMMGF